MYRTRPISPIRKWRPEVLGALIALSLIGGCAQESEPATTASVVQPTVTEEGALPLIPVPGTAAVRHSSAPDFSALAQATFNGILEFPAVTLKDGEWLGAPYETNGATRPRVNLARDFRVTGDLDGDGQDEALVFLETTTGGTGAFLHLAVMGTVAGTLTNLSTEYLGDRVQIINAHIDHDQILITLVRAGAEDAACCPGEIGQLAWQWLPGEGLTALSVESVAERLGPVTLADAEWVLREWDTGEPAASEPRVTLNYSEGRLAGAGGCNRYFTGIEEGGQPGTIKLGPVGSTQMACPEDVMAIEQRFLTQLQAAQRFDFHYADLLLSYSNGETTGIMRFEAHRESADD